VTSGYPSASGRAQNSASCRHSHSKVYTSLCIQCLRQRNTAWTLLVPFRHHGAVRVLPHIKKLNDALGDFLVRITCPCGASRHIEPEALARIAGKSAALTKLATRMRCSQCGKKVAEVVAVARPRPRGGGRTGL